MLVITSRIFLLKAMTGAYRKPAGAGIKKRPGTNVTQPTLFITLTEILDPIMNLCISLVIYLETLASN